MNIWLVYIAWLTLFSFILRVLFTTHHAVMHCFTHLLYRVHLIFYANRLPTSGSIMLIRNIAVTLYFWVGKVSSPKQGDMLCAQTELENSALNSVNWGTYERSFWTFRCSKPCFPSSFYCAPVFRWASSGVRISRGRLFENPGPCLLSPFPHIFPLSPPSPHLSIADRNVATE